MWLRIDGGLDSNKYGLQTVFHGTVGFHKHYQQSIPACFGIQINHLFIKPLIPGKSWERNMIPGNRKSTETLRFPGKETLTSTGNIKRSTTIFHSYTFTPSLMGVFPLGGSPWRGGQRPPTQGRSYRRISCINDTEPPNLRGPIIPSTIILTITTIKQTQSFRVKASPKNLYSWYRQTTRHASVLKLLYLTPNPGQALYASKNCSLTVLLQGQSPPLPKHSNPFIRR
ncbi:hypothetical protein TNCV_3283511 [Trichonephila clavipes]|nr:hypothetical protein TNCV_3283511 [Trichonephila clavipes]